MNAKDDREERLVLELLEEVGRKSDLNQRHLAGHMGVALGLANSYLKRCIRKGWIKITTAPANRYLYYLTPKGFSEKSRLTAKYLAVSFAFYRNAGESCVRVFEECERREAGRILLCGQSDLAEIAVLRSLERKIDIVGVYDAESGDSHWAGRPVWQSLKDCPAFDVCVLTGLNEPLQMYTHLVQAVGASRILVPDILRIK